MTKNKVYDFVTDKIISQLENGIIPWKKPWVGTPAINYVTRKPYRGINALMLEPGEYLSFKQIKERGGFIKKGAKAQMVVFYKVYEKYVEGAESEGDGELKRFFLLRYYNVYHINDVEGIESKLQTFEHNSIEEAEKIVEGYINKPEIINENLDSAFYSPGRDIINMPYKEQFKRSEEYYSTLFHEMVHSTGHMKRLGRFTGNEVKAAFGSETYSKEELVAELGSAMLCNIAGIDNTLENSTAYIQSWLKTLKNDNKFIVQAAGLAQKACDHILGNTYNYTESEE